MDQHIPQERSSALSLPKLKCHLSELVSFLDKAFRAFEFGPDIVFSEWGPRVIDISNPRVTALLEPSFLSRWNGLMFQGASLVSTVYFTCFPSTEALSTIALTATPGSVIFCHHALDYRSGSSEEVLGAGFVPWNLDLFEHLRNRGVSLYVSHAPLDYNPTCGTTAALADALEMQPDKRSSIIGEPHRTVGLIGEINPVSVVDLKVKLSQIAGVTRVDCFGDTNRTIQRVAVVAGECTSIKAMRLALDAGADAFVAGEVVSFASGSWGEARRAEFKSANIQQSLVLMAISHGASESIVFEKHLVPLITERFGLECHVINELNWWR